MLFFLSDKQVLGYMAVPYILFALLLFSNFRPGSFRPGERRSWALLALSFCFLLYSLENGTSQRNDFMSSPFGSGIRELQTAIRNVRISKDTTFCTAPDTLPTHSGTASFWTFLEAGRAFWLVDFGDGYKRQFLYYDDPRCSQPDVVHVTIKQRSATLSVTDIEGPDGVLYPKLQGTSPH